MMTSFIGVSLLSVFFSFFFLVFFAEVFLSSNLFVHLSSALSNKFVLLLRKEHIYFIITNA